MSVLIRFVKPYGIYAAGQEVLAGKGRPLGGGVARTLLWRRIAEHVAHADIAHRRRKRS